MAHGQLHWIPSCTIPCVLYSLSNFLLAVSTSLRYNLRLSKQFEPILTSEADKQAELDAKALADAILLDQAERLSKIFLFDDVQQMTLKRLRMD